MLPIVGRETNCKRLIEARVRRKRTDFDMFSTRIILLHGAMPLTQDGCDTPRNILSESQDVLHTGLTGLPASFRLFLFCRTLLFISRLMVLRYVLGLINQRDTLSSVVGVGCEE